MKRQAVRSRDLAIVGYDNEKMILEVAFKNGGVYHYQNVPRDVYDSLMKAESHGTYFNQNIKDCYPSTKLH